MVGSGQPTTTSQVPVVVLTNPSCDENDIIEVASVSSVGEAEESNEPDEGVSAIRAPQRRFRSPRVAPGFSSTDPDAIESAEGDQLQQRQQREQQQEQRQLNDVSPYQQQKRVRLSIPVESDSAALNFRKDSCDAMWADPEMRSQVFKRRSAVSGLSPNTSISIGAVM